MSCESVSVIIPNFNRAHLIGETLRCMVAQTRPPDEIIVVDDGSTDGSRDIIQSFGSKVRLIVQNHAGSAVARNRGFEASTGQYIQFMDSDDLCALNKIEEQLRAMQKADADMSYSPVLRCTLGKGIAAYSSPVQQQGPLPPKFSPSRWFARGWGIYLQACLFRRDRIVRAGPFETDLMPSEDYEFLFRILLSGARPVHVPSTLFLYRLHSEQITGSPGSQAMRRADYVKYVEHIRARLRENRQQFGAFDLAAWSIEASHAKRELFRLDWGDTLHHRALPFFERAPLVLKAVKDFGWKVSRRLRGRFYHYCYAEGPLTRHQQDLVRALGYEPYFFCNAGVGSSLHGSRWPLAWPGGAKHMAIAGRLLRYT